MRFAAAKFEKTCITYIWMMLWYHKDNVTFCMIVFVRQSYGPEKTCVIKLAVAKQTKWM